MSLAAATVGVGDRIIVGTLLHINGLGFLSFAAIIGSAPSSCSYGRRVSRAPRNSHSQTDAKLSPASLTTKLGGWVRTAAAMTSVLRPFTSLTGVAGVRGKQLLLRVIEAIEQWFLRIGQLLQCRAGAGQILGALA